MLHSRRGHHLEPCLAGFISEDFKVTKSAVKLSDFGRLRAHQCALIVQRGMQELGLIVQHCDR